MKRCFITLLLFLLPMLLFGQKNDVAILLEHRVDTIFTYKREYNRRGKVKRKRTLIEVQVLNAGGQVVLHQFFRKNKLYWERQFEYYDDHESVKIITDKINDQVSVSMWERASYPMVLTGGIPGFFSETVHYANGLVKSETRLGGRRTYLLEYEYKMH